MRPLLLAGLVLGLGGCAGESGPALAGPPADVGHGSVEEVLAALEQQGVPCPEPSPAPRPPRTEQAVACTLQPVGEQVTIVHFLTPAGSRAFEEQVRGEGGHGAYADTWAARTRTAATAELLAPALRSRGSS